MELLRGLPEALRAFVPLLEVLAAFAVALTAILTLSRTSRPSSARRPGASSGS